MNSIDINILVVGCLLFACGIYLIIRSRNNYKNIIPSAINKANALIAKAEDRVDRLISLDREINDRLKRSRAIINNITYKSSAYASNLEIVPDEELLPTRSYHEDREEVSTKLKKLATKAIDGIKSGGSDVNIGNFVAISTKADIAGALLLTTVEMICCKTNATNGRQSFEKLAQSIIATEALLKCLDSRAKVNHEFRRLLLLRLEIEININKTSQLEEEQTPGRQEKIHRCEKYQSWETR